MSLLTVKGGKAQVEAAIIDALKATAAHVDAYTETFGDYSVPNGTQGFEEVEYSGEVDGVNVESKEVDQIKEALTVTYRVNGIFVKATAKKQGGNPIWLFKISTN